MIILYALFVFINIFCLVLNKKSRIVLFLSFLFLVVLMAGNTFNGDYIAYQNVYKGFDNSHFETEYGIKALFYIGNVCNLSFGFLRFLVYFVGLSIILYVAFKMGAEMHGVFFVYILAGFIYDTVLLRTFIAIVFLTISFYFQVKNKKLMAFLFVIIACFFHKTMIVYLPLLFVNTRKNNNQKLIRYFALVICFICVVVFLLGNRFEGLASLVNKLLGGEGELYFNSETRYGFLAYFAVQILSVVVIRELYIKSKKRFGLLNNKLPSMTRRVRFWNYYVIFSFPFVMISVAFYRIFRNILFINLIVICCWLTLFRKNKMKKQYFNVLILLLLFAVGWRILYFIEIPNDFSSIIFNNYFINLFM